MQTFKQHPFFSIVVMLLLLTPIVSYAVTEVPMVRNGGVFTVPVRINNVLTLDFILDSGAADVQVPADVVLTLLRTGTISQDDFLPGKTYSLADGSTVKSPRFMVRQLRIGDVEASRVPASIGGVEGSLLLGQSVLSRFTSWSLDNKRHKLILGDLQGAGRQYKTEREEKIIQPPIVDEESRSRWSHNGSMMILHKNGNRRIFTYAVPNKRMFEAGVSAGTTLFEGERQGNRYTGTARVFSRYCEAPLNFHVEGVVPNEKKIILRGRHQHYDKGCMPSGRSVEEVLEFQFVGND